MVIVATPRSTAKRSVLRRALPRTKNGIFFSSFSASGAPGECVAVACATVATCDRARRRRRRGRGDAQMRRRGAVRGTRNRRGTSSADAPRAPSSADAPRCRRSRSRLRSPSAANSAPENPARGPAPKSRRRECRSRLAMWRSICVPSTSSGCSSATLRLDFEIVVGDQRLDAVELGGVAHFAREFARSRCRGRRP